MTTSISLACCVNSTKIGEELFNNPKYSDLAITCQGRSWFAHKVILSPRCPFFAACMDGPFKEGQENQIDLPGDGPVAIDRFIRYLYVGDPDEVVHGISETPPPSLEYLSSLFTTFATADKYFAWGLKTHILELLADYLHARPPVELRFVSWKSCQEKMTPAEFVRTRVGLIKMAYEWDVPGVKTLRKEIASVLTSGWLPQLMKFNAMVDVMLSNPQLGVDLLCEDVEVADGTQHLSI